MLDTPILLTNGRGVWQTAYQYGTDGYMGYHRSRGTSSYGAMSAQGDLVGEYDINGNLLADHYPLDNLRELDRWIHRRHTLPRPGQGAAMG